MGNTAESAHVTSTDDVELKARLSSQVANLGGSRDSYARNLLKWALPLSSSSGSSRIGRPPQPPQTKDGALLKARKEAYTDIYDTWDTRDKARKTAAKRAANAETNAARGKQPSGASNRRARELGETGPLARIIKMVRSSAGGATGCSLQEGVAENRRLLGREFVEYGQQVEIRSAVRAGDESVAGMVMEPAQLCSEDERGRVIPSSVVKRRTTDGVLQCTEPRHCHLVRLHSTGEMIRFAPAHVVPFPRNGTRVGNFTDRSRSETGIVVRFAGCASEEFPGSPDPSFYHVARSFYVRQSHVNHMVDAFRRSHVPLRVGDWVWVDSEGLEDGSMSSHALSSVASIDEDEEFGDLDASDRIVNAISYPRELKGDYPRLNTEFFKNSMNGRFDSISNDPDRQRFGRESNDRGPFTSRKAVGLLLDVRSPEGDHEPIHEPDFASLDRAAAEAMAKLAAAQQAYDEAVALQVTTSAVYEAIEAQTAKAIYNGAPRMYESQSEYANRRGISQYMRGLPMKNGRIDWSECPYELHQYVDRVRRDSEKEAQQEPFWRRWMLQDAQYDTSQALIAKGSGDLFDSMWAAVNGAEKAELMLDKVDRETRAIISGPESAQQQLEADRRKLRAHERLQECLPLTNVCIIKAITPDDRFELGETFVATDRQSVYTQVRLSEFDILGEG